MKKRAICGIIICIALAFAGMSYAQGQGTQAGGRLIDINSASYQDLMGLPGMDPITAQGIIDGRPYSNIQQLRLKAIVPAAEYDAIKGLITVGQAPGGPRQ